MIPKTTDVELILHRCLAVAFNLLNAAWETALPLSVAEQCVLSRLACATHQSGPETGLAFLSLALICRHCKLTKRGALNILARLTNPSNPVYCVEIFELGTGTRATRYRVLLDRLLSGERRSPLR